MRKAPSRGEKGLGAHLPRCYCAPKGPLVKKGRIHRKNKQKEQRGRRGKCKNVLETASVWPDRV